MNARALAGLLALSAAAGGCGATSVTHCAAGNLSPDGKHVCRGGRYVALPVAINQPRSAPAKAPVLPSELRRATHLAAAHRRPGEIVIQADGRGNFGPHRFADGIYRVRFQQFDASENIDFANDASSLVVQLDRRPGEITGETVTVFNATAERGSNLVTIPSGIFYVAISSADYGVVLRFTPT